MSDLVERLRKRQTLGCTALHIMAADEIERLTAERDRQYDQNIEQQVTIERLTAVKDAAQGVTGMRHHTSGGVSIVGWDALQVALAAVDKGT